MRDDLSRLVRELRARAESFEETDWLAGPAPAAAVLELAQPTAVTAQAHPTAGAGEFERLAEEVEACRRCPLGSQRLRAVFGVGSPSAEVMFVGEGPGFEEDHKGEPFVGKSGQLLDKILESIGLSRKTVYIANIVKCHPMIDPSDPERRGNDRPPSPEEIAACRGYLDAQIDHIRPKVIVTLGAVAARVLLSTTAGITSLRGQWREYRGIRLLPTYHPAALLRNPDLKRDVWTDMKNLKQALEDA